MTKNRTQSLKKVMLVKNKKDEARSEHPFHHLISDRNLDAVFRQSKTEKFCGACGAAA